jgi:F0F1-type ATP synthase assembly protein I
MGGSTANTMLNPAEISKQILSQLKKTLKSLIILFICSVIFCLLMGYLIDRTLTQMDAGPFALTNSIIFLLILITINLAVIVWSLKKASAKEEVMSRDVQPIVKSTDSPLETAIAALILNFIKEREESRAKEHSEKKSDNL